jgi:hypothetical protein
MKHTVSTVRALFRALSRDLVEHLTRCRYELVVTTTELTKGQTGA